MARKEMGPDELSALLEAHITRSVGWLDSSLSRETKKVLQFYDALRPERVKRGQSSFVSQDVYHAVEAMHAQLLETFTGVQELVRFAPRNAGDVQAAEMLTDAVNCCVHCLNPGYDIFSDVIKGGLMSRHGIAKVWWEDAEDIVEEEVPGPIPGSALTELAKPDDVHEVLTDDEVQPGVFSGATIRRKVDKGRPHIAAVPNSEFLVSKRARSLAAADFVAHRTRKDRAQLLSMGLTKAQIADLKDDEGSLLGAADDDQLFRGVDDGSLNEDEAPERKRVWVYECYLTLDYDGSGEKLWKFTKAGTEVFDPQQVKRNPFVAFVALRRPHSFWGNNYAAREIGTQNAKTGLTRAVLDHTAITINPRLLVTRGTLQNPQELNDDRLGGIVNVNRPDGVMPLVQPPMSPFVFQILQTLDYSQEDTTGISRISTGLNKDALSNNNSAALVENLQNAGQIRQKIIARNFALGFLVPLFQLVAELIAEHAGDKGFDYTSAGQSQVLPRKDLDVERDLIVELHLGYGEADKEAQKWLMINQLLSADPGIAHLYTPQQKYQVYTKVLRLKGIKDTDSYITPPDKVPPPQPDPMAVAELQLKQQELQLNQTKMQLETMQVQAKIQEMQVKLQLEQAKLASKTAYEDEKLALERTELALKTYVETAEVQAMQKAEDDAAASGGEKFQAVAAPRG